MPVIMPDYTTDRPHAETHPLAILQAAAKDLESSTNGMVRGSVLILNPGGEDLFRYTFYLVAPTLDDFRDPLFYAWHKVKPYPVTLMTAGGKQGHDDKSYKTSTEFEKALSDLFNGESARQHIYSLLDAVDQAMPHAA
jgi:hypothetical protein